MTPFSVYDPATGQILRTGLCGVDDVIHQAGAGEAVIALATDPARHYVKSGARYSYPPRPGSWASWDLEAEAWIDARSAEVLAADLHLARAEAHQRILSAVALARRALITDLPGQDMVYLAKEAEAQRWQGDATPDPVDYPLISAELGLTAPDAPTLVALWLSTAAAWRAAAARLERLRLSARPALELASTESEVESVAENIIGLIAGGEIV